MEISVKRDCPSKSSEKFGQKNRFMIKSSRARKMQYVEAILQFLTFLSKSIFLPTQTHRISRERTHSRYAWASEASVIHLAPMKLHSNVGVKSFPDGKKFFYPVCVGQLHHRLIHIFVALPNVGDLINHYHVCNCFGPVGSTSVWRTTTIEWKQRRQWWIAL